MGLAAQIRSNEAGSRPTCAGSTFSATTLVPGSPASLVDDAHAAPADLPEDLVAGDLRQRILDHGRDQLVRPESERRRGLGEAFVYVELAFQEFGQGGEAPSVLLEGRLLAELFAQEVLAIDDVALGLFAALAGRQQGQIALGPDSVAGQPAARTGRWR